MHVILANKYFYPKGGSETVLFSERNELRHRGLRVSDFSMQDGRNAYSETAEFFVRHKDYRSQRRSRAATAGTALSLIHSPEAVRQFRRAIAKTRPDIAHFHNVYHQLTPSIFKVAKDAGLKTILTLHDYKPVCPAILRLRHGRPCSDCLGGDTGQLVRERCADGSLARSLLLWLEDRVHRLLGSYESLDRILAPSVFMADSVTRSRFPVEKVRVLANGIDAAAITPSGIDDGYVLYAGRLTPEKGVETLLKAHRRFFPTAKLLICGTGPLQEKLQTQYPDATFCGHRGSGELAQILSRCALLAVPSEWYENCPMSILEAMAHGKPVVASRIGGIPELISDGETGELVPPADVDGLGRTVSRLLRDTERRRAYGWRARQRVLAEFSLQGHMDGLIAIYRELLA